MVFSMISYFSVFFYRCFTGASNIGTVAIVKKLRGKVDVANFDDHIYLVKVGPSKHVTA